jgi:peptide/nickel transport system ATP-binding protein
MIFQDPSTSLNPTMTVGRQVAEAVTASSDKSSKDIDDEVITLLENVGIPNAAARTNDYPHEFSGGQKQRIATAIALACDPSLLIADEPTTALDVTIQAQILELLYELRNEIGMGILFITHDLGVVQEICDRVAVMYAGSIVEIGEVKSVFTSPRHPYTKGLLASIPAREFESSNQDEWLPVIEGTMPELTGSFEGCKYADRCPGATEECYCAHPNLERVAGSKGTRLVACYHHKNTSDMEYEYEHEAQSISWESPTRSTETDDIVLHVEGLEKHFVKGGPLDRLFGSVAPIRAVDGISLEVLSGETIGLVGESGCGKSTVAKSILQLLEPTKGSIELNGQDLTEASDAELRSLRRNLQIVFQDPQSSLNPRRTVQDIIMRPMQLHQIGESERTRQRRIIDLINSVGLDQRHLERYPHELSGGQQQRVGIARALAVNPEVIILDEPVSGLDVSVQAQILNLLKDLQEELDLTYLFISHDLSVVSHLCDRVAVMYLGKIMEYGRANDVFNPPHHPYTESLLSAIPSGNSLLGEDSDRIILGGDVPNPSDIPAGCRFHPRCPHKIGDVCEEDVPLNHQNGDHMIHCHLMREEYRHE